jgi:hypothetical protein
VLASSEVLVAQRSAPSRVQLPKTDVQIAGGSSRIAYDRQEWREDGKAHHAARLSSNDVSRDRSNAPTNPRQIQHWAEHLDQRLAQHQRGTGARLVEVITQAGIGLRVARLWPGASKAQERSLKNSGGASRYCPICKDERNARGGLRRPPRGRGDRHPDRADQPPAPRRARNRGRESAVGAVPTRGVRPGQARAFMALNPAFARPAPRS